MNRSTKPSVLGVPALVRRRSVPSSSRPEPVGVVPAPAKLAAIVGQHGADGKVAADQPGDRATGHSLALGEFSDRLGLSGRKVVGPSV